MTLAEHRAAARIAWRHARRAKSRTALVLALVAFPVMALAGAGFVITSAHGTSENRATGRLGSAEFGIDAYGDEDLTAETLLQRLPAGSRVASTRLFSFEGTFNGFPWGFGIYETSIPPDQHPYRPRYAVLEGRMPRAAGEVAIHPDIAEGFDTGIGRDFVLPEHNLRLRVVGIAAEREDLRRQIILAGPGSLAGQKDALAFEWLIDLPPGTDVTRSAGALQSKGDDFSRVDVVGGDQVVIAGRYSVNTRDSLTGDHRREQRMFTGASFGGAVGALFGTGLIAAAAFGVGARRQLRTLGLVGAAGGESRHTRAIVLWGGTVLGFVGSAIGVALAIGLAYAITPHIDWLIGRVVGSVRLPWLIMTGAIALGTIASTLAAFGPARQASRMTTVDALAGRTPKPRAPGRIARRGLIAVIAGGSLMALATAWRQEKVLAVAAVITLTGFLLVIPLLVTWLGRLPARMPTSLRLAARQTARYGRRTGAAVAAATLALTAPVAIAAFTLSDDALQNSLVPIAEDQLQIGFDPEPESDDLLVALREAVPGSVVAPVRLALLAPALLPRESDRGCRPVCHPDDGVKIPDPAYVRGPEREIRPGLYFNESSPLGIANADLLRALDAEEAIPALEAGKVVAVGVRVPEGRVNVGPPEGSGPGSSFNLTLPVVTAGDVKPRYESAIPLYFISEQAAARNGLYPSFATDALLRAPHALSDDEVDRAARAASRFPGAHVTSRAHLLFDTTPVRLLITGGAVLVALIILAVAVALVAAESRREHAIVVAVGAGPGMRRRVASANAFLVTALAGLLAVPAGFVPIAIIQVARTANHPIVVPWSVIGIVAVGAPLLAGLVAAAVSREPTSRALLQPVW